MLDHHIYHLVFHFFANVLLIDHETNNNRIYLVNTTQVNVLSVHVSPMHDRVDWFISRRCIDCEIHEYSATAESTL